MHPDNEFEACWHHGKSMTQVILLLDYEPRTAVRVTEALAPLGCQVATARDVDAAVAACAKADPQVVLTTSVLPRLKVEDAIMQLRARAGLRNTPFVVLMSGYTGQDPIADAHKLGAQDIVAKPFSNDELLAHVRAVMAKRPEAHVSADTRAEVLEALKRAGGSRDAGTISSKDLFADLLAEEQAHAKRIEGPRLRPAPMASPCRTRTVEPGDVWPRSTRSWSRRWRARLAEAQKAPPKVRRETGEVSVDKLLEDTLSGLEYLQAEGPRTARAAVPGRNRGASRRLPAK